jgi:hypothetical protein
LRLWEHLPDGTTDSADYIAEKRIGDATSEWASCQKALVQGGDLLALGHRVLPQAAGTGREEHSRRQAAEVRG